METMKVAYGEKLDFDEAVEILIAWQTAGSEHGLLYYGSYRAIITAKVKIEEVGLTHLVCFDKLSTFSFVIEGSEFIFGPMIRMEYPEKKDSDVKGIHVYLPSNAGYLFISNKSVPPDSVFKRIEDL